MTETTVASDATLTNASDVKSGRQVFLARYFAWGSLAVLAVFLINNYISLAWSLPGAGSVITTPGEAGIGWFQFLLYVAGLLVIYFYVQRSPQNSLRADSQRISDINAYIIRAAFWAVFLIGLVDMTISFLRVEGLLDAVVGEEMGKQLSRSRFRGPYVHVPLIFIGLVIAVFTRTLGFIWLALLIVAAELAIVFSRFVFSYEQAFMGDLVRFWYAALFLFASAYTLLEEGHVRVDVFYSSFSMRKRGAVNAIGTVFLGLAMCWCILIIGLGNKTSIVNSPMMNFEVSQSGFGMYVKYLMAGFLGLFAISMAIQFASYFLDAVADYREEAGKREIAAPGSH